MRMRLDFLGRSTVIAIIVVVFLIASVAVGLTTRSAPPENRSQAQGSIETIGGGDEDGESEDERAGERHNAVGEAGEESAELRNAFAQFRSARGLGLLKDPGAYTDAYNHWRAMPTAPNAWTEVTTAPYNSDAAAYQDPVASNSGGGAGFVTGRIVGLSVDPLKHGLPFQPVYAAGAQGGVFRSLDNGGTWTPISDAILTLATGDVRVAPDGSLWYGTGEPNYGDELGSGVYRLAEPWKSSSAFTPADRLGGEELEAHWIGKLAFDGTYAYAATSRGVYRRPWAAAETTTTWKNVLAPVQPQASVTENIADDIVVQPGTGYLIANLAYRSTMDYNGFYISRDQGVTWTTEVVPTCTSSTVRPLTRSWSPAGESDIAATTSRVPKISFTAGFSGRTLPRISGSSDHTTRPSCDQTRTCSRELSFRRGRICRSSSREFAEPGLLRWSTCNDGCMIRASLAPRSVASRNAMSRALLRATSTVATAMMSRTSTPAAVNRRIARSRMLPPPVSSDARPASPLRFAMIPRACCRVA
jgi:hypothetical protein